MADVDDGEEAGAKDSGPAIMSRGGQHGDVRRLDSFLRGTDDWHQPLGAESYETEDEGEEAREGSAESDMDAEEAELSGGAPSTPDKTPPHNTCIFTFTFTIHQMKLLSFTFMFTIHLLEILREFRSLADSNNSCKADSSDFLSVPLFLHGSVSLQTKNTKIPRRGTVVQKGNRSNRRF